MPKEDPATPSVAPSTKTRRILGLLFLEERKIIARCSRFDKQLTRTLSLHGTGLIHHATTCHFPSSELCSLPELRGTMQTELDASNFYLPSRVPVITEREAQQLEIALPTDVKRLDSISTQVLAKRQTYDVNTLFHQYRTYQQHQERTQWYMILVTSIGVAMFLGFALFLVYSRFQNLLCFFILLPTVKHLIKIRVFLSKMHNKT